MKKNILLLLSIFIIFIMPISSNGNQLEIHDSSKINHNVINKVSARINNGGSIPIGSIATWFYDTDPEDNGCISAKTGGDGTGGKCKWLECNGQKIDTSIYTEYNHIKTIPNFQEDFVPNQYNKVWGRMPIRVNVRTTTRIPDKDDNLEHHVDGIVSFNIGSIDSFSESDVNRYRLYSPFSSQSLGTKTVLVKGKVDQIVTVRYLIRVSN